MEFLVRIEVDDEEPIDEAYVREELLGHMMFIVVDTESVGVVVYRSIESMMDHWEEDSDGLRPDRKVVAG